MPDGYDTTMPIRFDPSMLDTDFRDALNAYTAQAESVGAVVLYHLPPMNALAVSNAEDIDTYADYLQSQLTAPLAGDPHACDDAGWFDDTNFHLNVSREDPSLRDSSSVTSKLYWRHLVYRNRAARHARPPDTRPTQKPQNNSDAAEFHMGKSTVLSSMQRDAAAAP